MIKIRLSGGPNGQRFEGFANKNEVERYIRKSFNNNDFEFVKGAKHAQYIIVPNDVACASKSASLTQGHQLTLDEFYAMMTRTNKKSSSASKKVSRKPKKVSKKKSIKRSKKVSKKSTKKRATKTLKLNRPSPSVSATEHNWETRTGNDGNLWTSKPNKNGVFSWRKV